MRLIRHTRHSPALRRWSSELVSLARDRLGWVPASDDPTQGDDLRPDDPPLPRTVDVGDRVTRLGAALDLSPVEVAVLEFVAAMDGEPGLDGLGSWLGGLPPACRAEAIAASVEGPVRDVAAAIAETGTLSRLELVICPDVFGPSRIELGDLPRAVLFAPDDLEDPLLDWFPAVPVSTLDFDDFAHVAADVERLRRVLTAAVSRRPVGFDLLLIGPPGTGKTELARLLVAASGGRGIEVRHRGDNERLYDRFGQWCLAQRVGARLSNSVVLFDECEDAFARMRSREEPFSQKAWFTRTLDEHAVPSVWVANDLDDLDPAMLRRFDVVFELGAPPFAARRRLVAAALGAATVPAGVRDRLAADERLTPAALSQVARALDLFSPTSEAEAGAAVEAFVAPHLARVGPPSAGHRYDDYDPRIPKASHDLERLADGLATRGRGAVLLHGPPGTGKTGWAHHLARRAGRPLVVRTGSDLLGPFVGQTEQQIASSFRQAAAEGAVLLLDEVDTVLRSRASAQRGFEASMVNEVLARLDDHDGIVVCTTNRLDDLDAAALRRFAVHVAFAGPDAAGRAALVERACHRLGIEFGADIAAWAEARELMPGAVGAACDEVEILGDRSFDAFRAAVERRLADARAPVGFRAR